MTYFLRSVRLLLWVFVEVSAPYSFSMSPIIILPFVLLFLPTLSIFSFFHFGKCRAKIMKIKDWNAIILQFLSAFDQFNLLTDQMNFHSQ